MNDDQLEKADYVNGGITTILRASDVFVYRVKYRMDGADERVEVVYGNNTTRAITVTGKSKIDILRAVLEIV